jgi:hypothetical protein
MNYLSRKATAFLSLAIEEAERKKNKTYSFGRNHYNNLKLQVISEDAQQTIFALTLPVNRFTITISFQNGFMFPFKYVDNEHLFGKELYSINETSLTKGVKEPYLFHYVLLMFVESLVESFINYSENSAKYNKEFEDFSFLAIRQIFLLCILESQKFASWGVEYALLGDNSVTFKVNGNHFVGLVKITLNRGKDLYEIVYLKGAEKMPIGGRKGVFFDELIDVIDKKIEYIPDYQH